MCDANTAVSIICKYADEYFSPVNWPKDEFNKWSYQQWLVCEICHQIMDHPFKDPTIIIENFIFEMAMYASYSESKTCSFIFQTAVETAEELILLFV